MRTYIYLSLLFICFASTLKAQPANFTLAPFASGLNEPLDMAHCGDNRIFIAEKDGVIKILDSSGTVYATPFMNINSLVGSGGSEQGLLGLAFHPDYKNNGYFYVNYTNNSGDTRVSRFSVTANPDSADPASELNLLSIDQPYSNHNGGCLKFGRDGFLYIGMGDGGSTGDPQNRAQNKLLQLGKMLRIDVDHGTPYSIPVTNPYYLDASYSQEIWAMGMRNPWRFCTDKSNGDFWIGDVGQGAWEEVDYEAYPSPGGNNWGWRCYEGNSNYNTAGCQPIGSYDAPSFLYANSGMDCAILGGHIYRGGLYPSFYGYYFAGDNCSGKIWWVWNNGTATFDSGLIGNYDDYDYSSFGEDYYGELYLLGIGSGNIWHLEDSNPGCVVVADIFGNDTLTFCNGSGNSVWCASGMNFTYQWFMNGNPMAGETDPWIDPSTTGNYSVIVGNGSCSDTSDIAHIIVETQPTASFSGLTATMCDTLPPATLVGNPAGGTFYGTGITGSEFDPSDATVGTHTIVYWYVSAGGCIASDTQMVEVIACPLGIEDENNFIGFSLSPNPVNEELFASFSIMTAGMVEWTILDLLGRIQSNGKYQAYSGKNKFMISTVELPSGIYFVELKQSEGKAVRRVVVD